MIGILGVVENQKQEPSTLDIERKEIDKAQFLLCLDRREVVNITYDNNNDWRLLSARMNIWWHELPVPV